MSATRVYVPSEFDVTTAVVVGTAIEKNRKGGSFVPISSPDKTRVLLQIPSMPLPFGVSPYVDAAGQTQSYSLDCSFRDGCPAVQELYKQLKNLDAMFLDLGVKRSQEFFGKKYDRSTVEAFYRPLVKQNNPEYPPVVKVKVPLKNGEPDAQFFDECRAPAPGGIDYLIKGSTVRLIVEVSSIWFVNKTYGVTLKLVQAQATSRPLDRMEAFAFVDEATTQQPPVHEPGVEI